MDAREDDEVADSDDRAGFGRGAGGVKLSDVVYAKIAGRIRSGEYPVESRLPTENDLADALGVSRPIVREALARLRNDGVVVSRRGSGTYVQRAEGPTARRLPPLTSISDMRRCLEFRISLEGECAWHAALGKDEHRTALREAMAQLSADLGRRLLEPEHDFDFHHAVALATGNRFFHETMSSMRPTILTALQITPSFISPRSQDRLKALHVEHEAIFTAILANDADGARTAMRTHLSRAMQRVFEGL
ncbi:MAG TPA: FadR/GntR family transcriptional regulator [Sphingomonas sp.]